MEGSILLKKTMKALVYEGPNQINLKDVPTPKLEKPTDAIAKVTLSTICTSDIHIAKGHIPFVKPPIILGHEFCAELIEVGSGVKNFKPGDRVHVAPLTYCGECPTCKSGRITVCDNGGGFGIKVQGCQAEYIRIPNADRCMIPIPDNLKYEDVLLLGDMLATAYFGINNADVKEGDTVAVIGLGPVGFCTCILLKKMFKTKVIAITRKEESLQKALKEGVADYTINESDPELMNKLMKYTGGKGAGKVIETAGVQATMDVALNIVSYRGTVSTVAVFSGPIQLPMQSLIYKNVKIHMGIQRTEGLPEMMKLIENGTIDTNFVLTHKAPLNDILKGYEVFGKKQDGCIKWAVTPYEE